MIREAKICKRVTVRTVVRILAGSCKRDSLFSQCRVREGELMRCCSRKKARAVAHKQMRRVERSQQAKIRRDMRLRSRKLRAMSMSTMMLSKKSVCKR